MGVYICESGRIHMVYSFFDVCLCVDGFRRLYEGISKMMSISEPWAPSYVLRFACASISVPMDDLFGLYEVLGDAMDRIVLQDLEGDLQAKPISFEPYRINAN